MEIGSGQGLTASQVWNFTPKLLSIGAAGVPSGATQTAINFGPIALTATGTVNKIVTSGTPGILLPVGFNVSVALAGGVVTAAIEYVVDGSFIYSFPLYSGAITWDISLQTIAQRVSGTGSNIGDILSYLLPQQFSTSLTVRINITATTLTAGTLNVCCLCFTHP